MPTIVNPASATVPILSVNEAAGIYEFAGSGFCVGSDRLVVTAEHVVRGAARIAIASLPNYEAYDATLLRADRERDVAILHVPEYDPIVQLRLATTNEISFNQLACCIEFAAAHTKGDVIQFSPATRLGNVTRMLDMTAMFGKGGEDMLELSFPVLRGASGSVVANASTFLVYGVVVANVSYELLPAQIETVLDERNNLIEERRFMLPQGLAVNATHIKDVIDAL